MFTTFNHVNMYWLMFIRIEEKDKTKVFVDFRHIKRVLIIITSQTYTYLTKSTKKDEKTIKAHSSDALGSFPNAAF